MMMRTSPGSVCPALDSIWETFAQLGLDAVENGRAAGAGGLWRIATDLSNCFDANDPRRGTSLNGLGASRFGAGDIESAEQLYREAIAIWKRAPQWIAGMAARPAASSASFHTHYKEKHPDKFMALRLRLNERLAAGGKAAASHNLGMYLVATGRRAEAEPLFRQALEMWQFAIGFRDEGVARILEHLSDLCDPEEAADLRTRMAEIRANPSSPRPARLKAEADVAMTDERKLKSAVYLSPLLS